MIDHIAHLNSRVRCLELQAATWSGLHDAWVGIPPSIARKELVPLVSDRLGLTASVAQDVREAVDDCVLAGAPFEILPLFTALSQVLRRFPAPMPGVDTRVTKAAIQAAREAVLNALHQSRRRAA